MLKCNFNTGDTKSAKKLETLDYFAFSEIVFYFIKKIVLKFVKMLLDNIELIFIIFLNNLSVK